LNFKEQMIYLDDTIETIKKKIVKSNMNDISYKQIYLFTQTINLS